MGLFSRIKARIKSGFSPAKLVSAKAVAGRRALHDQFQRIGGNLTPQDVSWIMQAADAGQPAQLIDLYNESRQKDGHLQSVCWTRESAVGLCEVDFVVPDKPKLRERKAAELCKRIVDDFDNWPTLIEILTSSFVAGHATAEIKWRKTPDNLILPYSAKAIPVRDFVFSQEDGSLRYATRQGDLVGVDILADNPGRIVQLQRRIVGDVPAREGLIRILVWSALFRNWALRDWIALGEVGWKPWRIGRHKPTAHQEDIDKLVEALEEMGSSGVAAFPDDAEVSIEWPNGNKSSSSSTHRELFDAIGRELSKATIGQTTTIEAGPNGDRASTQTRDQVRLDIRESDAVSVAAALRAHLFAVAVALNLGDNVRCPVPWFATDEAIDQVQFATAVEKLQTAGCRIPAKWVRDEIGMPEPEEGEEILGDHLEVEDEDIEEVDPEDDDDDDEPDDDAKDEESDDDSKE